MKPSVIALKYFPITLNSISVINIPVFEYFTGFLGTLNYV